MTGSTFVDLYNLYDDDFKAAAVKARSRNRDEARVKSYK